MGVDVVRGEFLDEPLRFVEWQEFRQQHADKSRFVLQHMLSAVATFERARIMKHTGSWNCLFTSVMTPLRFSIF